MLVLTAIIWFHIRVNIFIYDIYKIIRLITSTTFWPPSWTPSWPLVTWLSGCNQVEWCNLVDLVVCQPWEFSGVPCIPLLIPGRCKAFLVYQYCSYPKYHRPRRASWWIFPQTHLAQVAHLQLPKMPSRSFHSINNAIFSHPLPTCHLADWPPNLSQTQLAPVTPPAPLFTQLVATFLVHAGNILFLSINSPPLICNMYCHLFPQIPSVSQTDLLVSLTLGNICLTNLGFAAIIALGKFLGWVFEL